MGLLDGNAEQGSAEKTPAEMKDQTIKEQDKSPQTDGTKVGESAAKGTVVPAAGGPNLKPAHLKSGETQDANYDEQTSDPRFPDITRMSGVGSGGATTRSVDYDLHPRGITVIGGKKDKKN